MGGIHISVNNGNNLLQSVIEMEEMEKKSCNFPLVFTEMLKDEINANDEIKLYNGVKRIIRKYSENQKAISAINEFTSIIAGGASLEEIIRISLDESENPSLASKINVDDSCKRN
jgi:hypothetical protein